MAGNELKEWFFRNADVAGDWKVVVVELFGRLGLPCLRLARHRLAVPLPQRQHQLLGDSGAQHPRLHPICPVLA